MWCSMFSLDSEAILSPSEDVWMFLQGLFGNTAASQSGGLFGSGQTSTATGFGTASGLFGQPNTGFGNVGTQVGTRSDPIIVQF